MQSRRRFAVLALGAWALYSPVFAAPGCGPHQRRPDKPPAVERPEEPIPEDVRQLQRSAEVLFGQGKFDEALPLARRYADEVKRLRGGEHAVYAESLNDLGALMWSTGDYAAAEPLLRQALAVNKAALGEEHPQYAISLNNLAMLLWSKYDDTAAVERLLRQALAVREAALGIKHPDYAASLNNLAALLASVGDPAAEPLLRQAVAAREAALGDEHPDFAESLNNLAMLLQYNRAYAAAEPLYRRALEVNRGALGEDHPSYAASLVNLAGCCIVTGKAEEALRLRAAAWSIVARQRRQILAYASEREQAAYAEMIRGDFDTNVSLAADRMPADPAARRLAARVVIDSKGVMLEALAARRADAMSADDPALRGLFDRWRDAAKALAAQRMVPAPRGRLREHEARLAELAQQQEEAEQALGRASQKFATRRDAARVGLPEVAAALAKGSALVEFVRYQTFNFEANNWGGWKYAAVVIRGGQINSREPEVALVPLGRAAVVEQAVAGWRQAMARHGGTRPAQISAAGAALGERVWEPVAKELAACRRVYVSPDGELAFIPFAALPGREADTFVLDDFDITYVASGRDLARERHASDRSREAPPVLVGAPAYGSAPPPGGPPSLVETVSPVGPDVVAAAGGGLSDVRAIRGGAFDPLPGTEDEVRLVAGLLGGAKGRPVPLTGAKATEAAVVACRRPGILHLATHGFFLPDSGIDSLMSERPNAPGARLATTGADPGRLIRQIHEKDPMQRSGVALAGCNDTLAGRRKDGGDDGLLTAAEVIGMDLLGTRLVVISACESGLGEGSGGEGVYGLRRAFALAGAQDLVMSLWKVDDLATRDLMVSMYEGVAKGEPPPLALLAAQRRYVGAERNSGGWPHPHFWAAFAASGTGPALEPAPAQPTRRAATP